MQRPLEREETAKGAADEGALYDRFGPAIFAYVRLHTQTREDAEDLTLEVFMRALAYQSLGGLGSGEQLAWLRRVAYNKLIDRYRHAARHPVSSLDEPLERALADDAANPEEVLLHRESYMQLHHAVQTLSPLQQHFFRLRY